METKFKITIPKPCHEDWNAMTPDETGRFCSVCTKGVVDFTDMKAHEIQAYFIKNQGKSICGRFKKEQIKDTFDLQIPQSVLQQQMSFHRAFLLTLFVVMGSTLFSCKNHDDATLGEVSVVEDSVKTEQVATDKPTLKEIDSSKPKLPTPPKSDKNKTKERLRIITGDVTIASDNHDRIQVCEDNYIYGGAGITVYPDYIGGTKKFYDYIRENYKFPKKANKINGELRASFVIEKDGKMTEIKIIKDLGNGSGDELIRVLNKSANWNPAEHNGKKQKFYFELPVFIKKDTIDRLFDKKITAKIDAIELIRITKFDN